MKYQLGDTNGQPLQEGLFNSVRTRTGKIRGEMANALMEPHRAGKDRTALPHESYFPLF